MSRQVRQRVTAIVLGGLIFGAPLLTNGTASAERISEGGARQVTFSGGGMFGISCRSEPDVESMVVPAQSTIRVVNRTGYAAKLMLGDDTKGTLADNAVTEVIFRRGTTAVVLKPNCALGDEPEPVLVTASPSAGATTLPDPMPAPSDDDEAPSTLAASDPARPSGSAAGTSAAGVAPVERPARVKKPTGQPGTRRPHTQRATVTAHAATTATQAMPHGGSVSRPKVRTKTVTGTAGGAAPAFAGMPPGNEKAIVPGVPQMDVEPMTVDAAPAAATPPPTDIAAAEPVAALEPMSEGGPVGLLGLIASVCVLGVAVAAIRAIVSQRANRSRMA